MKDLSRRILLVLVALLPLSMQVVVARQEDIFPPNIGYFYGKENGPIKDFHYEDTPFGEDPARPNFLYNGAGLKPRLVMFYAHWCPHCKRFRNQFVAIATQLDDLAHQAGTEIDIIAVSCGHNLEICEDEQWQVDGYPMVYLFEAGATNFTIPDVHTLHPLDTLRGLGVKVDPSKLKFKELPDNAGAKTSSFRRFLSGKPKYKRTKENIVNDAHLSIDFAFRTEIFRKSGPLNDKQADALKAFLHILHKTLPLSWTLQFLITDVLQNFDDVCKGKERLLKIADKYPPVNTEWSLSCTHGDADAGYACGLWQLFHIVTVGVVEWNRPLKPNPDPLTDASIGTEDAAVAIRDYINSFFGCSECRKNFVKAFDDCKFDRCHRLNNTDFGMEQWVEFPLWLFETHNAVNVRLMKEKAARENLQVRETDEIDSEWPSRKACPLCWKDDGTWDKEIVFKFLRLEYWPDDELSAEMRKEFPDPGETPLFAVGILPCASLIGLVAWFYGKKLEKRRIGHHKKI